MNIVSTATATLDPRKHHQVDGCDTVPQLFLKKVTERGDRIAMREKDFGLWRSYSWLHYHDRAMCIANGLHALGHRPGDVVAILAEDCKEWVWADMGIMLAGGVVNGVYPTYQPDQLQFTLTDSRAKFLFVGDEEQLDKYLSVRDELADVHTVFYFDKKGLRGFDDERVRPIEWLYDIGKMEWDARPKQIEEIVSAATAAEAAVIVYTSGTTGKPKGAVIPQSALLFQMTGAPDRLQIGPDDELLTYLPLCHLAERVFSLCLPLATGATINFAESPESVQANLQELSPTVVFGVPRIWEKFYSRITTSMSEATLTGRAAYQAALWIGRRRADRLISGRKPTWLQDGLFGLADRLVLHNLKQLLGLDRVHFAVSGAAPISDSLLKWFLSLGIPITEVYGQTELGGIATVTRIGEFRPGTVGVPLQGAELRIADNGEILIRSEGQFSGYLNLPETTSEAVMDGWVRTGDVGRVDADGNLHITDRIKDIIITAGGKNITPSQIENELKYSPFISDGVVIGDRRKYLTALVMLDKENVEHFAQTHAIPFTDYRSLCARPEVIALIEREVQRVNEKFSSVEQVKKFRLIDVLLTPEDEELTPTMKLKRSVVSKKYEPLINAMYD